MVKFPVTVQFTEGVTPAVLEITISVNSVGVPATVKAPEPPNITWPVLLKLVPARVIVLATEGVKNSTPSLVTVPLLLKPPWIV